MHVLREWKKVLEGDLDSIVIELQDFLHAPSLILLSGDVGVGKTTFAKAFVKHVLGDSFTFSPTYSVINELGEIVHADFYRLKDPEEVVHLEIGMYVEDKEFFLLEWGRAYLNEVLKELPRGWSNYEIIFEVNDTKIANETPSRNIRLIKLPQD